MTANVEGMVRSAVDAIRAGNKADARTFLDRALELDEYNEEAWLWLSSVVDTPEEQRTCLDNVLIINPRNEKARAGLKALGIDPDANSSTPALTNAADDLFPSTPAFNLDDDDDLFSEDDFSPSTPSFDSKPDIIATSSASSSFTFEQPAADVYDDWVANLGINKGKTAAHPPVTEAQDATFGLDFDDDFFSSPPPATPAVTPAANESNANPFGEDPFGEDPFAAAPSFSSTQAGYDDEAEEYTLETESFESVINLPVNESFENLFDDDLLGMGQRAEESEDVMVNFEKIPSHINAGRLPGINEKAPTLLFVGIMIAILWNVGAVAVLLTRLG